MNFLKNKNETKKDKNKRELKSDKYEYLSIVDLLDLREDLGKKRLEKYIEKFDDKDVNFKDRSIFSEDLYKELQNGKDNTFYRWRMKKIMEGMLDEIEKEYEENHFDDEETTEAAVDNAQPANNVDNAQPVNEPILDNSQPVNNVDNAQPANEPILDNSQPANNVDNAQPVNEPILDNSQPVNEPIFDNVQPVNNVDNSQPVNEPIFDNSQPVNEPIFDNAQPANEPSFDATNNINNEDPTNQ